MPGSVGGSSYCSRRSSPDAGPRLDPFQVLDAHQDHWRATSIIKLKNPEKVYCPICLDMRSEEDVANMEMEAYNKYLTDLFDMLEKYGEDKTLRKIVLSILEIFLSKRTFVLKCDDQYHRILRVIYRLMKSDHYGSAEFVTLTKIMSAISIESLQPVPLKSAWEAWKCMLEYDERFSIGTFIDRSSENIPDGVTKFLVSQATIVKSYLKLINGVAKNKIADLIFLSHKHKQEPLNSKYHEKSQATCLRFFKEKLYPNCEFFLQRVSSTCANELQLISELFSTLRECFINATARSDTQFLSWLKELDMIMIAHRILREDPLPQYRLGIYEFLKSFTQYQLDEVYGANEKLKDLINRIDIIETTVSKLTRLQGNDSDREICLFYLILNWVAIKSESRYYVASRFGRVLMGSREPITRPQFFDTIKADLIRSRSLRRIFAFVVAKSIEPEPSLPNQNDNQIITFFKEDWRRLERERRLDDFRYIYCRETNVFEWASNHPYFTRLLNCNGIEYLIDRGVKQNNLVRVLKVLMDGQLRQKFKIYFKRDASSMFEKILPLGTQAINRSLMNDFSSLLPAQLQETILRLRMRLTLNKRLKIAARLNNLILASNLMLRNSSSEFEFAPHFCEIFIDDLTRLIEETYKIADRSDLENNFLLASHEFMALLIETKNPCFIQLCRNIDYTLLGYMYCFLENYQFGDSICEAIARVLVAYDKLDDYPLNHRLEMSLYLMPSSAYEWMLSSNTDLHLISLRMVEKFYSSRETHSLNHMNLLDSAKACLVTGFLNMLCVNSELIEDRIFRRKIVNILKYEDFKCHPLYPLLMDRAPKLKDEIDLDCRELGRSPPSPEMSFASASDFEEEQMTVSRILDLLHEDEGYRSASTTSLPRNIYLTRVIDENTSNYPGTQEWERRAYEQTLSINVNNDESARA